MGSHPIEFMLNVFIPEFQTKFMELLLAPVNFPETVWIIIPLVLSVILLELYFGWYPREDLGFHGALENTVFLIFVGVDLIKYLILEHRTITNVKVFMIGFIVVYGIIVAGLDFFHKLSRNIALKISSKSVVGFTAYIGIIVIYSDVLNNLTIVSTIATVFSVIIMFLVYSAFIATLHILEPKADDEVESVLTGVEKDIENAAEELKKDKEIEKNQQ